MDQIGLELLHNFGALHLGQIEGEGNVIVKGKSEPLGVLDAVAKLFGREFLLVGLAIDGEDLDIISRLGKEFEHLIEAIGVAGYVGEWRRLDHEGNFAWLVPTERWCVGIVPPARVVGRGRNSGGIQLRRGSDGPCRCSSGPSRWSPDHARGEEGAGYGRRRGGNNISLDGSPAQYAGTDEDKREGSGADHLSSSSVGALRSIVFASVDTDQSMTIGRSFFSAGCVSRPARMRNI